MKLFVKVSETKILTDFIIKPKASYVEEWYDIEIMLFDLLITNSFKFGSYKEMCPQVYGFQGVTHIVFCSETILTDEQKDIIINNIKEMFTLVLHKIKSSKSK